MEPLKKLSLLLEPSTEATIQNTLDYFLALLYRRLKQSPKRGDPACEVFNEFVDCFRRKLLALLDDVEQFFLWAVAAVLDGRKIGFDWLKPVWDHHREWPNVTERYPNLSKLKVKLEQNIAEQVIFNLALCMSFPHYWAPAILTLFFLAFAVVSCKDKGIGRDHLWRRKLRLARKEGGLRLKTNGGQAVCAPKREERQSNDGASAR